MDTDVAYGDTSGRRVNSTYSLRVAPFLPLGVHTGSVDIGEVPEIDGPKAEIAVRIWSEDG